MVTLALAKEASVQRAAKLAWKHATEQKPPRKKT
jgi:hypothetical protein